MKLIKRNLFPWVPQVAFIFSVFLSCVYSSKIREKGKELSFSKGENEVKLNNSPPGSVSSNTSKTVLNGDVLGGANNFSKEKTSAITFGLGDVSAYTLEKDRLLSYNREPSIMLKLPNKFEIPSNSILETVEEIDTNINYYDGSPKLNKKTLVCTIHTDKPSCLNDSLCGWCGSENTCVRGTNLGPLSRCKKATYVFASPIPSLRHTIETKVGEDGKIDFSLTEVK